MVGTRDLPLQGVDFGDERLDKWGGVYARNTMGKFLIGFVLVLCACSVAASSGPAEIQEAIDRAGAHWTAGENQLTGLDADVRRMLTGGLLLLDGSVKVDPGIRPSIPDGDIPVKFDWRDHGGSNWMTGVKHQGGCGSCAAFASVGALEARIRIALNDPALDVDLSEQHLFSCAGGDCPTGLYMGDAMDYMTTYGVPDEACLPYTAVDDNCDDTCSDWQDRVEKLDSWNLLWQYEVDEDTLKLHVLDAPVACYLEVYDDFFGYDSGVYEHVTGDFAGGHFVVIVGWDDALNCWICKNSWGETWGETGYFRILRGETQIGSWAMVQQYTAPLPPTPQPSPTPSCIHDGDVNGSDSLTPEDALLGFNIYLGLNPDPTEQEACSADCTGNDTVTPEDALCIFMHYVQGSCDCVDGF